MSHFFLWSSHFNEFHFDSLNFSFKRCKKFPKYWNIFFTSTKKIRKFSIGLSESLFYDILIPHKLKKYSLVSDSLSNSFFLYFYKISYLFKIFLDFCLVERKSNTFIALYSFLKSWNIIASLSESFLEFSRLHVKVYRKNFIHIIADY